MSNHTPSPEAPVEPQREESGEAVDALETGDTGRRYECLDCGNRSGTFLECCSNCGGTAFEATTPPADSGSGGGTALGVLAALTAPFNPCVPR